MRKLYLLSVCSRWWLCPARVIVNCRLGFFDGCWPGQRHYSGYFFPRVTLAQNGPWFLIWGTDIVPVHHQQSMVRTKFEFPAVYPNALTGNRLWKQLPIITIWQEKNIFKNLFFRLAFILKIIKLRKCPWFFLKQHKWINIDFFAVLNLDPKEIHGMFENFYCQGIG